MVFPPAPANRSTMVSLEGVDPKWEGMSAAIRRAMGSGVTPNQADGVRRMS